MASVRKGLTWKATEQEIVIGNVLHWDTGYVTSKNVIFILKVHCIGDSGVPVYFRGERTLPTELVKRYAHPANTRE
jgi:hypothetical protein